MSETEGALSPRKERKLKRLRSQNITLSLALYSCIKALKRRREYDLEYWTDLVEHHELKHEQFVVRKQIRELSPMISDPEYSQIYESHDLEYYAKYERVTRIYKDWAVKTLVAVDASERKRSLQWPWMVPFRTFLHEQDNTRLLEDRSSNEWAHDSAYSNDWNGEDSSDTNPWRPDVKECELYQEYSGYPDLVRVLETVSSRIRSGRRIWCPITKEWWPFYANMAVVPVVPSKIGAATFAAIFGIDELYSADNSMLVYIGAARLFDEGAFVLTPALDGADGDGREREVTRFRLNFLGHGSEMAGEPIYPHDRKGVWKDLDGQIVDFGGSNKPRTRYLFFHYCLQLVRQAMEHGKDGALNGPLGKVSWGVREKYLPRSMLQDIVDVVGHEELLDHAFDSEILEHHAKDSSVALMASLDVIDSREPSEVGDYSDDDDD